jgi:prepilin-type N-terminal cleavage/methylation domain-containing protein
MHPDRPRPISPALTHSAFTLIELLVVIGIIVIVVLLAIPVLNVLQGNNSIDSAQNQIQALLNEARMLAIGVQRDTGVLFYIDPNTKRVNTVLVQATDPQPGDSAYPNVDVFLDLIPDHESVPLTVGLTLQVIDNATVAGTPPERKDDGYIGFNQDTAGATIQYGGVILFDLHGQLVARTYGFRLDRGGLPSDMHKLLYVQAGASTAPYIPGSAALPPQSKFGLVLFPDEAFKGNEYTDSDTQIGGGGFNNAPGATLSGYDTAEKGEEDWIDQNSVPFMVNRYNGTLIRGE